MSKPATIANSDIIGAVAANRSRSIARHLELDTIALQGPRIGQVWKQVKGPLEGRKMSVYYWTSTYVYLKPLPESWRTLFTRIRLTRFLGQWRLEDE